MTGVEAALALVALATALWLRPWRLLAANPAIATPLLATLVVLPWLWGTRAGRALADGVG